MGIKRRLLVVTAAVAIGVSGALIAPKADAAPVPTVTVTKVTPGVDNKKVKVDPNKVTPKASAKARQVCEEGTEYPDWGNRGKKRDFRLTVCFRSAEKEPGDYRTKVSAVLAPTNRHATASPKVKIRFNETGDGKGVSTTCATGKKAKKANSTICGKAKKGAAFVRTSDDFVFGARVQVTAYMLVGGKWVKAEVVGGLLS